MARRKISYRRPRPSRYSKPRLVLATEGEKTERIYFDALKMRFREVVTVLVRPGSEGQSNPARALDRLTRAVAREASWSKRDEAWLVVDTDQWAAEERSRIEREIARRPGYHLASSNPSFELWLLLHFREGWQGISTRELLEQLRESGRLPTYTKAKYDPGRLLPSIDEAIRRAEASDHSEPDRWTQPNETQVYRLVRKIRDGR